MSSHLPRKSPFAFLAAVVLIDALFLYAFTVVQPVDLPLADFLRAHGFGAAISAVSIYTGVAGGLLWFPAFLWLGVTPKDAVSLALFTQLTGTGSGTVGYVYRRMIAFQLVRRWWVFVVVGVVAGYGLGWMVPAGAQHILLLLFAISVLGIAVVMLGAPSAVSAESEEEDEASHDSVAGDRRDSFFGRVVVLTSCVVTGLLSIASAVWTIPYMERRLGIEMHIAVATGLGLVFIGTLGYLAAKSVAVAAGVDSFPAQLPLLWGTCSGVIVGAQIGTALVRLGALQKVQRHVFMLLLFLAGADMLRRFISAVM